MKDKLVEALEKIVELSKPQSIEWKIAQQALSQYKEEENKEVTRFEVIDHSPDGLGRVYTKKVNTGTIKVDISYQDDGKTLKIFIN